MFKWLSKTTWEIKVSGLLKGLEMIVEELEETAAEAQAEDECAGEV